MLVSHTQEFIHLKTFKAAGTSVEAHFQPWCMPSPNDPVEHYLPETISRNGIVGARGSENITATTRYRNHMSAVAVREAIGRRRFRRYLKFAVARDPYERVVSGFWFTREPGERERLASAPMSEVREVFAEVVRADGMARWATRPVVTIDGSCVLDRVIRYERLVDDVERISKDLGLPMYRDLPRLKVGTRLRGEPASEYYDAETQAAVQRAHAWEFDAFGYPR